MCICDAEAPDVYQSKTVKARKGHRCIECGDPILASQFYELAKGIYDGEWITFKTCNQCVAVRDRAIVEIDDFCHFHGGLFDELDNCGASVCDDTAIGRYCPIAVSKSFTWLTKAVGGNYRIALEIPCNAQN